MTEESDKALDHCIDYAIELITDTGEAYPFGAFIDTIGNVHPLEVEVDKKKIPNIGEVIERLGSYCEKEMAAEKMNGYALCYEVRVEMQEEEIDCICVDIKHANEEMPLVYLPFSSGKPPNKEMMFAVKRQS